jgi:hypothetical protein
METSMISRFLIHYIPGFWYFMILVMAHTILSTIVHIKDKDFDFKRWPDYMKNFIYYMAFLAFINGLKEVAELQIQNGFVSSLLFGLQAFVYAQPITYYMDNVLTSLCRLGFPVSPELIDLVRSISSWMKELIGR